MTDLFEFTNEEEGVPANLNVEDFGQAVLWGTDWTVETIVAQLRRGNIEINPRFQRRDAWNKGTKSRFIESVILGLPVPQVVLAESKDQRGKYVILDGKQRLLALMQFSGLGEGPNNAFGLSGLEVRQDLLRKKFRNFEKDAALQRDLSAFQTNTIRAVIIRNWPSISFLHVVFQRLNTGSLKLSPQELRQALAPGEFTNYADDASVTSKEVQSLLGRTSPDPRMRDVELLVRFIAFRLFLPDYTGRMKDFLDWVCIQLNENWGAWHAIVERELDQFKVGILALEEIFGADGIARKRNSRLFNRSIFDALSYYVADPVVREAMLLRRVDVVTAYEVLITESAFEEAIESDTAGLPHTAARLQLWGGALESALGVGVAIPQLEVRPGGETRFRR